AARCAVSPNPRICSTNFIPEPPATAPFARIRDTTGRHPALPYRPPLVGPPVNVAGSRHPGVSRGDLRPRPSSPSARILRDAERHRSRQGMALPPTRGLDELVGRPVMRVELQRDDF